MFVRVDSAVSWPSFGNLALRCKRNIIASRIAEAGKDAVWPTLLTLHLSSGTHATTKVHSEI